MTAKTVDDFLLLEQQMILLSKNQKDHAEGEGLAVKFINWAKSIILVTKLPNWLDIVYVNESVQLNKHKE